MIESLPSPDVILDVEGYERRRYPRGPLADLKRRQDVRTLREAIGPGPLRVLDLPCGWGRLMDPMMERSCRVVGADLSGEMLAEGRRRLAGRRGFGGLVRCDVRRLPFQGPSFDLVVCMRFLYYFTRRERVELVRQLARLSRRFLLLQYRIRGTVPSFLWRLRHRAGITARDRSRRCLTIREIREEIREAARLRVIRVRPVSIWFSDRAYVLCAKPPR